MRKALGPQLTSWAPVGQTQLTHPFLQESFTAGTTKAPGGQDRAPGCTQSAAGRGHLACRLRHLLPQQKAWAHTTQRQFQLSDSPQGGS